MTTEELKAKLHPKVLELVNKTGIRLLNQEDALSIGSGYIGYGIPGAYDCRRDIIIIQPDYLPYAQSLDMVVLHELTHSTGHRTRLARSIIVNVSEGMPRWSQPSSLMRLEESIAQYGAMLLIYRLGLQELIECYNYTLSYLDDWPSPVEEYQPMAEKAVDYLMGMLDTKAIKEVQDESA